jgi:enterochelin esterase family protein
MKNSLLALLLLLSSWASAQSFQDFIDYVNGLSDPAARQTAVDSFMNQLPGAPLIEFDTLVHFLYQGNVPVQVAGDFNGWNPALGALSSVGFTDLWVRTMVFEPNARLDYKFVLSGSNWILDPLNPNTVSGGFGPNSELAMPQYVQPWEIVSQSGIPKGTIETFNFNSAVLGGNYQVQVYLPPSYASHPDRHYPSIYVQDGQEYLTLGSAKNVLDNLIDAGLIYEVVGVFIRPNNRNEEYAGSKRNQYRTFLVQELIPHILSQYRVIDAPQARAAIGTSLGANISAQIAFHNKDVVGKAGLHSPAFWPNNQETSVLLMEGGYQPIKWAAVWGTYETSVFQNMEAVQATLEFHGNDFYGNYYPEGHSWGLWRATLDELLIELFPPNFVSVKDVSFSENNISVSPNPASPGQIITITLPNNHSPLSAQLFDLHGKPIAHWQSAAPPHHWRLPENIYPGIYILKTQTPDNQIHITKTIIQ